MHAGPNAGSCAKCSSCWLTIRTLYYQIYALQCTDQALARRAAPCGLSSSSARSFCCSCPRLFWCARSNGLACAVMAKQDPQVRNLCNLSLISLCVGAPLRRCAPPTRAPVAACARAAASTYSVSALIATTAAGATRTTGAARSAVRPPVRHCTSPPVRLYACEVWSAPQQGHHRGPCDTVA